MGDVRVTPLCDAAGFFPEALERVLPGTGLSGRWALHVHCFLVRTATATVLVDAGTGPAWAPATRWFGGPGRLLEQLATAGVEPGEVTHVVLTHLHLDHVGWVVHGSAEAPEPTFAEARHLVQRADVDQDRLGGLYDTHVRPLVVAGLLDAVDGPSVPTAGVRLVPTPGHTAGHQSVVVELGEEQLLLSGDAFVHPSQVADPEVTYAYEDDPAMAVETRRRLLAAAARRPTVIGAAHFPATLAGLTTSPSGAGSLTARATCTFRTIAGCP